MWIPECAELARLIFRAWLERRPASGKLGWRLECKTDGDSIFASYECVLTRYTGPGRANVTSPVLISGRRYPTRSRQYKVRALLRTLLDAERIPHESVTTAMPVLSMDPDDLVRAWRQECRKRRMAGGDGYDLFAAEILTPSWRPGHIRGHISLDSDTKPRKMAEKRVRGRPLISLVRRLAQEKAHRTYKS